MSSHGGDLLSLQVSSHKLPMLSRVYGSINPAFGQGEQDTVVHGIDQQLANGLVIQAIVYGAPGTPAVSGAKDAVLKCTQIQGSG